MRRILKDLVITHIAAVDRPCQEHARVTIMKRDGSPSDPVIEALRKRIDTLRVQLLGKRLKMLKVDVAPVLKKPKGSQKLKGASLGGTWG